MDTSNPVGDGLGRRRRRRRKGLGRYGVTLVGRKRRGRKGGAGCSPSGKKANGRLKKGFRWAKGRKGCAIPARRRRR